MTRAAGRTMYLASIAMATKQQERAEAHGEQAAAGRAAAEDAVGERGAAEGGDGQGDRRGERA